MGGKFDCSRNNLKSLECCPKLVGGSFVCYNNILTSLEGCPKSVSGDFDCCYNQLTSLEGYSESIDGDFYCDYIDEFCYFLEPIYDMTVDMKIAYYKFNKDQYNIFKNRDEKLSQLLK